MPPSRRTRRPLLALVALVVALVIGYIAQASGSKDSDHSPAPSTSPSASVALSALPAQAALTVRLIRAGGPFPYPRNDGVVFHNDEHRLPTEADGYYHEYTVPTPGSSTRGARRLVTGRDGRYWYTGDHYETFKTVDVSR